MYDRLHQDAAAGVKLLLVDACRDDPQAGRGRGIDADNAPPPPRGIGVLLSCSAGQRAFEHDSLRHGVFFHHVIEGLKGGARDGRGRVTWDGLRGYVKEQVATEVPALIGGGAQQSPEESGRLAGAPPVLLAAVAAPKPAPRDTAGVPVRGDGNRYTSPATGMEFVRIPKGTFTMGSPASEADRDKDETQHEVTLTKDFFLGVTEVTRGQFRKFVADGGEAGGGWQNPSFDQTDDHPVVNVSWDEAARYAEWLSRRDVRLYHLPTEAEWEYSCRGGAASTRPFGVGDGRSLSSTLANFDGNYPYGGAGNGPYLKATCKVASYQPNAFGLHDMHGNVWEWCSDWFADYPAGPATDPRGPSSGSGRVYRGGSWYDSARFCRSANRDWGAPSGRYGSLGFRLALVPSGR